MPLAELRSSVEERSARLTPHPVDQLPAAHQHQHAEDASTSASSPTITHEEGSRGADTQSLPDACMHGREGSASSAEASRAASEGTALRPAAEPGCHAQQQQQQDAEVLERDAVEEQQSMLYSSAPAALHAAKLWRSNTEAPSVLISASSSLLNVPLLEDPLEGTCSPRACRDSAELAAAAAAAMAAAAPFSREGSPIKEAASAASSKSRPNGGSNPSGQGPLPTLLRPSTYGNMVSPRMSAPSTNEPMQSFLAYLHAEVHSVETHPTGDVLWGQTERDRVYNFLLYVPFQLERLIQFGLLLCFDSFLGVMTLLPLRCFFALQQWFKGLGQPTREQSKAYSLGGGQVFDLLCLFILLAVTVLLRTVRPGFIYYWLKDITNEFLKMSVLSTAFEIADKILCNFGLKVMEALSGTCTLWASGRLSALHLLCDTFVALLIVMLHAVTLMCQGLVLAVALNSNRNGLLALLIASYFAEIKSVVFKRWDVERIRSLAWMDVVERFHLICILVFVVVEDMDSSATWSPSATILQESVWILGAEVVIDIVKHAVLGKFNDVRPGIYREYMKDLCDKVCTSQSHNLHKLLDFHHLACCALFLRTAVTLFWLRMDDVSPWQVSIRAAVLLAAWLLALVVKTVFGYAVKIVAHQYVAYHSQSYPHGKPMLLRGSSGRVPGGKAGRKELAPPGSVAAAAPVLGGSGGGAHVKDE